MDTTALFLDCSSRNLHLVAVSVTRTPLGGLVLREGVVVGGLGELSLPLHLPTTLLVGGRAYEAQSSAGFTGFHSGQAGVEVPLTGVAGLGRYGSRGFGLRPAEGTLIACPAGAWLEAVRTHRNSNQATAAAAAVGLGLMAQTTSTTAAAVVEGQSDVVSGWRVVASSAAAEDATREWLEALPLEHRLDIIQPDSNSLGEEAAMSLAERCLLHGGLTVSVEDSVAAGNCRDGSSAWAAEHFPGRDAIALRELVHLLGNEEVDRVARHVLATRVGGGS